MATITTNYTQTVVTKPTAPSTTSLFDLAEFAPLIRERVAERMIDEPRMQADITSARSFFNGDRLIQADQLLRDLRYGQQLLVPILKDQNPFSLFQSKAISYTSVDSCRDQISLDCNVPCINTLPSFDEIVVRFDTEYAYGVRACAKNIDFWPFDFYTDQYQKSRQAEQFGREVDLWNKVIRGLIASPATTVAVKLATVHPTHYWPNLGPINASAIATIREAYWYHVTNFSGINDTIFITAEASQAIIAANENPYNLNKTTQRINTFEQWDVPGFMVDEQVREILGISQDRGYVVIMKNSPWMTYSLTTGEGDDAVTSYVSQFPLWSQDTTKQYVAILDPRVGYEFDKPGFNLVIRPYDCNKLTQGMIDTEYVASGITFPQYGMILEFSQSSIYTGAAA